MDNYPNPFSLTTTIPFRVHVAGKVDLSIYETSGKREMTLIHEYLKPGEYQVILSVSILSNGIYYYGLLTGNDKQFKKLVIVK
jgi:acyl-[acyl carrier protein]--UDP-N-acetylglucosamine O-acyltransferase